MKTINYSGNEIFTGSMFLRSIPDNAQIGKYLKIRIPIGYTLDDAKKAVVMGYFAKQLMDADVDQASTEFGTTLDNNIAVFQVIEYFDSNNELIYSTGHGTPTITGDDFTTDALYTLFNKTDDAPFNKLFELVVTTPADITDQSAGPLTTSSGDTLRTIKNIDWIATKFEVYYIEAHLITRHWVRDQIFNMYNPIHVADPATLEPPAKTSKLTSASYATSKDVDELRKYVEDLKKEISFFNEKGKPDQAANREKTIERVEGVIDEVSAIEPVGPEKVD
jgi:hypothetical protein